LALLRLRRQPCGTGVNWKRSASRQSGQVWSAGLRLLSSRPWGRHVQNRRGPQETKNEWDSPKENCFGTKRGGRTRLTLILRARRLERPQRRTINRRETVEALRRTQSQSRRAISRCLAHTAPAVPSVLSVFSGFDSVLLILRFFVGRKDSAPDVRGRQPNPEPTANSKS
jgi:hypothetical protein